MVVTRLGDWATGGLGEMARACFAISPSPILPVSQSPRLPVASGAHGAASYTPHVPPNPTVTLPPSTMTGTCRPPERRIIRSSSLLSDLTFT